MMSIHELVTLSLPKWMNDALCREVGIELFFGEGSGSHSYRDARRICQRCEVIDECLQWGLQVDVQSLKSGDRHGMFGGLTPNEREKYQAEHGKAVA